MKTETEQLITRNELAQDIGVHVTTLRKLMKPLFNELNKIATNGSKKLNPKQVTFIKKKLNITN